MPTSPPENAPSQVLLYRSDAGDFRLDVATDGDTVWLTQQQMANLFDKARSTIAGHISNVFEEGELQEEVVCRDFRQTTPHGAIEGKTQTKSVRHYNLDVIISVGYRAVDGRRAFLSGRRIIEPCELLHWGRGRLLLLLRFRIKVVS